MGTSPTVVPIISVSFYWHFSIHSSCVDVLNSEVTEPSLTKILHDVEKMMTD